jgi:hypothetical protein
MLTLAGCSVSRVLSDYTVSRNNWSKPGVTQQQLDADWYTCSKQNTSDLQSGMTLEEKGMAKQCMAARGYSYIESPLF